jgi:hypothetical protein
MSHSTANRTLYRTVTQSFGRGPVRDRVEGCQRQGRPRQLAGDGGSITARCSSAESPNRTGTEQYLLGQESLSRSGGQGRVPCPNRQLVAPSLAETLSPPSRRARTRGPRENEGGGRRREQAVLGVGAVSDASLDKG